MENKMRKEEKYSLYFAYGANMSVKSMKQRCPNAIPIGKAKLTGYELAFYGVATVLPKKGSFVPGVLWKITPECLKSLDRFEGYPKWYGRREMKGTTKLGKAMDKIQIYIINPWMQGVKCPPCKSYWAGILQGYKDFGWTEKARINLHGGLK